MLKKATKIEGNFINMNDALGRIEIYNAKVLSLTINYKVLATFTNLSQY
jgi:hypothetical protein